MNRADYVRFYNRLQQTKTRYTECLKITRPDGAVFRFTALDKDLVLTEADGLRYTYKSADGFKLTALENSAGLVVSNMDIDAIVSDDTITEDDLFAGFFENARFELFLCYWSNLGLGVLPLRTSWVGELALKGVDFRADLRGIAQRLAQVFSAVTTLECRWSFGDSRCGINKASYTRALTVTATNSQDDFFVNADSGDYDLFKWGLCTFTSGANEGIGMEVIRNFENRIHLFLPVPFPIEIGDTVDIVFGCDKRYTTCKDTYDNVPRFGGEPFLAGSDLIVTYPRTLPAEPPPDDGKF